MSVRSFIDGEFKIFDSESEQWVVEPIINVPVMDLLEGWSILITELSFKEIELYECKEAYQVLSDKTIEEARRDNVDFKKLYGGDNQFTRKQYVKEVLHDENQHIKDLEFSIDYLTRKISFMKQLIHTKTIMMEIKE